MLKSCFLFSLMTSFLPQTALIFSLLKPSLACEIQSWCDSYTLTASVCKSLGPRSFSKAAWLDVGVMAIISPSHELSVP